MNIDYLVFLVELIAKCNFINITTNECSNCFYKLVATNSNGEEIVRFHAWLNPFLDPFVKSHQDNKYISMSIKYYGHPVVYTHFRKGCKPTSEQRKWLKIKTLLIDRLKSQQMYKTLHNKVIFSELQKLN